MISFGRIAADQTGIVIFHDHPIDQNCVGRDLLQLFGSFCWVAFFAIAFQNAVFDPHVNLVRMHVATEPICLAHDIVDQHYVEEIPYLYDLLNRILIELTSGVFVV